MIFDFAIKLFVIEVKYFALVQMLACDFFSKSKKLNRLDEKCENIMKLRPMTFSHKYKVSRLLQQASYPTQHKRSK